MLRRTKAGRENWFARGSRSPPELRDSLRRAPERRGRGRAVVALATRSVCDPRAGMASQQPSVPCVSRSPPEQPLQVKVVGLFKSSSFQIAKSAAEVTVKTPQERPASRSCTTWWRGSRFREGSSRLGMAVSEWIGACRWQVPVWAGVPLREGLPLTGDSSEGIVQNLAGNER